MLAFAAWIVALLVGAGWLRDAWLAASLALAFANGIVVVGARVGDYRMLDSDGFRRAHRSVLVMTTLTCIVCLPAYGIGWLFS